MKFHFGGSSLGSKKYKDDYFLICKLIKKQGHSILHDWLGKTGENKENMYKKTAEAIRAADGVILEGTISAVAIGQQLTLALDSNKPTLILIHLEAGEGPVVSGSFSDPAKRNLLYIERYTQSNLEQKLDGFFKSLAQKHGLTRINLVLDRTIDNYLEWSAFQKKKSKSQIIRDAMQKEIDQDLDWKKRST
ncbi:hypothetical protein HZB69_02800 [Candidatus Amesbacteria bacterium]|nr:hypothetical protein [Candidatus Amesbacteria bacterium]